MKKAKNFCTVKIEVGKDEIICTPIWPNIKVDWPEPFCISLRKTELSLAKRYKGAVEAGKIYTNPQVVKTLPHNPKNPDSISGPQQTYVKCDGFVMAKYLNSDLIKLGY